MFEAWIGRPDAPSLQSNRAGFCTAVPQPEQQNRDTPEQGLQQPHTQLAGAASDKQQQQHQPKQQSHQVLHACRLLGTDSTEDMPAGDKQEQSDQAQGSGLQQPEQVAAQQAHQAQPTLPPAFTMQQPASHKELLAHLLMPAPSRAAAASIPPRAQQQQQQQGARRLRRLPQGRRSSMLGTAGGNTMALHGADAALEDSPGPIQQQQLLHMRAQYLLDAQSQAAGATAGTAAAAAAPPAAGLPGYAVNAHQQLFSPRTATHAPVPERGSSGRSRLRARSSDVSHHSGCGHQHAGDAVQQPDTLQQQAHQLEQPEEIEVTPAHPRRVKAAAAAAGVVIMQQRQQQQQWGSGAALTRTEVTAPTAAGVALLPATATTPEVLPDAGTGITNLPADDTPAADVTAGLIAAAGSHRAAAAAAAGLAAALFHTPGPHAALSRVHKSRRGGDTPQPGAIGDAAHDLPCGQQVHRQAGLDSMADAAEANANGGPCAAGSSRTLWLDLQQRPVRELHVGLPVVHILCCAGYAAVLLQDPSGPSTYRLLLLHMQRAQQQGLTGKQQLLPNLQAQAVALTAESASVRLHSAQQAPLPAIAAAAARSASGKAQQAQKQHPNSRQQQLGMLRTGLLLLPPAGAATCTAQQAGPYLAVASDLHVQPGPDGCAAQPAAAAETAAPPCLPRHALAASSSKGKRKLPRAAGATQLGGIDIGASGSSCAVNIFQLHSSSLATQHKSPGATLVQSLPTSHAVRCLAACAEPPLLAAAGAAGSACVWPLLAQQHQQGTTSVVHPDEQGRSSTTTGKAGSSMQPVVDASAAVVLPAASYRGIAFPDMQEVCFVVQGMHMCAEQCLPLRLGPAVCVAKRWDSRRSM